MLKYFFDFFFQPVHTPVNRLFGNLQIPGYFMSAVSLDLHQNDLQGKPVHCDQYMIQFLILNMIQEVLCGSEKNENYVVELKLLH